MMSVGKLGPGEAVAAVRLLSLVNYLILACPTMP